MSASPKTTPSERVRAAEETVAHARQTLERAEAGLRAAKGLAEAADDEKSHPVRSTLSFLTVLSVIGLIVLFLLRD